MSTRMQNSEQLLTIEQTATRLNCSPWTIRRLIARGELRASRIGRLIRIRPVDVERAMKPVTKLGGDAA